MSLEFEWFDHAFTGMPMVRITGHPVELAVLKATLDSLGIADAFPDPPHGQWSCSVVVPVTNLQGWQRAPD